MAILSRAGDNNLAVPSPIGNAVRSPSADDFRFFIEKPRATRAVPICFTASENSFLPTRLGRDLSPFSHRLFLPLSILPLLLLCTPLPILPTAITNGSRTTKTAETTLEPSIRAVLGVPRMRTHLHLASPPFLSFFCSKAVSWRFRRIGTPKTLPSSRYTYSIFNLL